MLRIHSGILVSGDLSTAVRVTCNRCLEPIACPVAVEFEEGFRPLTEVSTGRYILPEDFEGTRDELEDEALLINEQHILDISEVVRQCIWLAKPMYPGCNWAGEGECPNLTAYLSSIRDAQEEMDIAVLTDDEEAAEEVDPRWSALLALKGRMESTE